ncbi:uncharacterized protein DUF3293 [Thioalkalivibrio sp. ALE21]|nr:MULTISPECIES: DUF3293 domain-containing protein [unclassified Thioalkalivibrio]PYG01333.1 uncharacterized protein DUF3293 [Thioalkalivibrio sp. ALE21]
MTEQTSSGGSSAPGDNAEIRRLEQVYAAAHYRVQLPPGPTGSLHTAATTLDLRIGEPHAELARQLSARGHARITLITAHNPFSRPSGATENARRQEQLRATITSAGRPAWPATSGDPDGEWPEEPGFGIPDLPPAIRDHWLEKFEQNAVVECEPPRAPELVWHPRLRSGPGP